MMISALLVMRLLPTGSTEAILRAGSDTADAKTH
jgi:hypothetical protein